MNSLELLKRKLSGQKIERPLFCPAIYEHKAKLLDRAVSEVAREPQLMAEAVIAEYQTYHPDVLTVGIDVYNIEAEAIGCRVNYPEHKASVPSVEDHILTNIENVDGLKPVDVATAGRMPLITEAVAKVREKLGSEVAVRGAVSGPFSVAANLMGVEPLLMAQVAQPEAFGKLLDYCCEIIADFGRTFVSAGASVCLFDSQASPPFVSPNAYEQFIFPRLKRLAQQFHRAGADCIELVVGGRTDSVAEFMVKSSFDIVLSDFSSSFENFDMHLSGNLPLIRRNISPVLIENGPMDELSRQVRQVRSLADDFDNVIVGTGVLSYDTSVDNVLKVKQMILKES